jgi:hypothetical protein
MAAPHLAQAASSSGGRAVCGAVATVAAAAPESWPVPAAVGPGAGHQQRLWGLGYLGPGWQLRQGAVLWQPQRPRRAPESWPAPALWVLWGMASAAAVGPGAWPEAAGVGPGQLWALGSGHKQLRQLGPDRQWWWQQPHPRRPCGDIWTQSLKWYCPPINALSETHPVSKPSMRVHGSARR